MTFYSLPAIVALVFKPALVLYVVRSSVKNDKTQLFLCLPVALSLFNFSEVFLLNYYPVYGIDRLLATSGYGYFATIIFAIAVLLHLSLRFTSESRRQSSIPYALLYVPAVMLECLLLFTDRVVAGFQPFQFTVIRIPGPWYFLFETYLTVYLAAALVNLLIAARNKQNSAIARVRNRLWLTGLAPMALLMIYLIRSRHMNWPQIPSQVFIPIAQTFFLLIATYATHQYRLFDVEFYIPWSKVRQRKTVFYRRIQATVAELAGLPSVRAALFRVSGLLNCPVALVGGWRPILAMAGEGAIEMAQFPHEPLNKIEHIVVANEIKHSIPEMYQWMQQFRVAAIVPFYPHTKTAASWMLLGESFGETVHTPLDFKKVERLFDSLGEFFLDKIDFLRTELTEANDTVKTLKNEASKLRDENKALRDYNIRLMMENHSLRKVDLPDRKRGQVIKLFPKINPETNKSLDECTAEFEAKMIADALKRAKGNKSEAGRLLGLKPNTLHYKMKRYGLTDEKKDE